MKVSLNTAQGINNEISINLHGIPNSDEEKVYYAWLLEDESQVENSALIVINEQFSYECQLCL
jgi:hypothetical protein